MLVCRIVVPLCYLQNLILINIANDVLTAVVPIPLIMRLKMPLRQRIGVCVLFGLGFIVIVAGSVRTYYIHLGLCRATTRRGTHTLCGLLRLWRSMSAW